MQPLKTYLVEDSALIRENLVAALEELTPVRVVGSAEDEAAALHWLLGPESCAALVIVDMFLKAGSGLGVLRKIQAHGLQARTVVLTNFATPEMRQRCRSLGADRVFDKSSEIDALIDYCAELAGDRLEAPP